MTVTPNFLVLSFPDKREVVTPSSFWCLKRSEWGVLYVTNFLWDGVIFYDLPLRKPSSFFLVQNAHLNVVLYMRRHEKLRWFFSLIRGKRRRSLHFRQRGGCSRPPPRGPTGVERVWWVGGDEGSWKKEFLPLYRVDLTRRTFLCEVLAKVSAMRGKGNFVKL